MNETLAQAIESDWVDVEQLDEDYRPVLQMVRELIGVVPNCNPVLEIWPPAFRTFNLLVPNLLNLPASLVGHGAPKDLVGIAMYASSNAAQCPYCTAHHCSFAIRRGADPDAVLGRRSPAEEAVAQLAEAMAVVPPTVTPEHIAAVSEHLSEQDVQWIVLAVSLGGFLNKVMDSLGIRLEDEAISDVQALLQPDGWRPGKHYWDTELLEGLEQEGEPLSSAPPAWSETDTSETIPVDSLGTYLRFLRQAPGAVRLEKRWTKGVSGKIGQALLLLEDEIGYGFPILATIKSQRVVKAMATALRDNLDPGTTRVGLDIKLLAGLIYAGEVKSELLTSEMTVLIDLLAPNVTAAGLAAIRRLAEAPVGEAVVPRGLTSKQAAALLLAKAASPSPANVTEITVEAILPVLDSDEIVEIISWLALLQTMNRLYSYTETKYIAEHGDDLYAAGRSASDGTPYDAELDNDFGDDFRAAG